MQAKKEFKQIEERCTAKAETLEDLRDMGGKSFRTADLEKLMEKYDPEAYAQYSKFAKRADGARTQSGLGFLSRWIDGVQKGLKDGTISSGNTDNISRTNESGLSSKAQEFLKNLRKQYGDFDFFVGNSTDNLKALVKSGSKEFSVVFSSAELERMASDEKYAKQRERIEKAIEEKRTEKKKEEKKAEKEIQSYSKSNTDTKRTNVQADSMEELFEKMSKIDWNVVKSEKMPESGGKFDFSI